MPIPAPEFTPEDVNDLIASFGRPIDPEKKATLLAKLEAERPAFEKEQEQREADHTREQKSDNDLER